MIKIPFTNDNAVFASEMKSKISGANLNLDLDNIESSLYKVAAEIPNTISQYLYNVLVHSLGSENISKIYKTALDYLQRAMLHFAIYEHTIFLIAQISNDGIVVKKNQSETTIFKYQEDKLNEKLITTGWFWVNQLIALVKLHPKDFPKWANTEQAKSMAGLPVDLSDFNKWVGVSMAGGEYFMLNIAWIIREVWTDCVLSRQKEPKKTDKIARAVCYEVIGRACQILAYQILPEPLRRDIDNEMGKNERTKAAEDIKERISARFLAKAATCWNDVDLEIKRVAIVNNQKNPDSKPVIGKCEISESDAFYCSC